MKPVFIFILALFSFSVFANDCMEEIESEVLDDVARELEVSTSELKVRWIGGESFDGDLDSGRIYKDHVVEYLDVFLANENPEEALALAMYYAEAYIYTDMDSQEVVDCEKDVGMLSDSEWEEIYELYL